MAWQADDGTITLVDGETAVVGFGLLLSRSTVDQTLGYTYDGPFVRGHLDGWRRSWGISMPNAAYYYEDYGRRVYPDRIMYLDLERSPGSSINCVVIVLDAAALTQMDGREWIYERVGVTEHLRGISVEGGDALVYLGRGEHRHEPGSVLPNLAVRRTYIDGLNRVLGELGASIADEFAETTDPVPAELVVNDVLDPDRLIHGKLLVTPFALSDRKTERLLARLICA